MLLVGECNNRGNCRNHETRTLHTLTIMPHAWATVQTSKFCAFNDPTNSINQDTFFLSLKHDFRAYNFK